MHLISSFVLTALLIYPLVSRIDSDIAQSNVVDNVIEEVTAVQDMKVKYSRNTEPSNNLVLHPDSIKSKPAPVSLLKLIKQEKKQPVQSNDVEIEIDGLLVDDTKTKAGKDFYDSFYDGWEAPAAARNYSITVSEKPFRLTTTMIVISINENIVYQDILQPRQDLIETQTADAIFTTQNYLANYEEILKQLNGDDQSGSGIY